MVILDHRSVQSSGAEIVRVNSFVSSYVLKLSRKSGKSGKVERTYAWSFEAASPVVFCIMGVDVFVAIFVTEMRHCDSSWGTNYHRKTETFTQYLNGKVLGPVSTANEAHSTRQGKGFT